MSNYAYRTATFEISQAQAIQAIGARCEITPDLNPILLKPLGNYYSSVYLNGKEFRKRMHASEYYSKFVRTRGIKLALDSLNHLQKRFDLVIMEGAGSPAEINLDKFDIANMKIAQHAKSPVIIISDIDRGGCFASIVGTISLLEPKYKRLVKGFVINKFRGDVGILKPGLNKLKQKTKKPIFGVMPMTEINLPQEDSLDVVNHTKTRLKQKVQPQSPSWNKTTIQQIDREITKLSKTVMDNLDIKAIERLLT
jgi:adenosylcobyric acid synthase